MNISKVELTNHPAQARSYDGTLQFDEDKPVPMFPNARAIRVQGRIVGYVEIEPGKPINFTAPPKVLNERARDIISSKVRELLKTEGPVSQVADLIVSDADEDEDE